MSIAIGDTAPGFELPGVHDGERRTFSLDEHRGRPVVLAFYPGDNTAVCTRQLCSYTNDLDAFRELDAQVLGISPQDVDSHEAFATKQGLGFPLLADTDKAVGRSYGILGIGGLYRRAVFVVDAGGQVTYAHTAALVGVTYKPSAELLEAVRESRV